MWEVEFTDEFEVWWNELNVAQQAALAGRAGLLGEQGPDLVSFDPRRHAILLLGGDKSGRWSDWYRWAIPASDDLYDAYLDELRNEGLIE